MLGGWGPNRHHRLVVATTDPARLPKLTTWYLLTNLARPTGRRAQQTQLAETVAAYGLRNWVEQGYKQVKDELGWADFQVRSDRAIRRHWTLVCCAFSFCWQAFLAEHPTRPALPDPQAAPVAARGAQATGHPRRTSPQELVAVALRAVRAWLTPCSVLQRCWRSWSPAPPPRQLQRLLDAVAGGHPLHLYLPP